MLIRKSTRADRAPIEEIIRENLGNFFNEQDIEIAFELLESYMTKLDEEKEYLHLSAENRSGDVVGYVCFGPIPLTDSAWDLYWIAVRSRQRRTGLGKQLVRSVEEEALRQGATAIYMDTSGRDGYSTTRQFYESLGYEVATRLEDFYRPGEDKIVYRKRLAAAPPREGSA